MGLGERGRRGRRKTARVIKNEKQELSVHETERQGGGNGVPEDGWEGR